MQLIKEQIFTLLNKYYSLDQLPLSWDEEYLLIQKFVKDKRNASLGDSLINFVYSCAKSITHQEITGIKISDSVLIDSFSKSKLSSLIPLTGKKKEKGNYLEALILYIWLTREFTIEEMVLNVSTKLQSIKTKNNVEEHRSGTQGLINLFDSFFVILTTENER